jgi:predicted RNA binding protein YcfA (HicA-like mRNA interferase family)
VRLPSFTPRRLIRTFQHLGFLIDHQSGSHVVLYHPEGRRAVIALHSRELKRGTLVGIIKQAGYTPEEFLDLIK